MLSNPRIKKNWLIHPELPSPPGLKDAFQLDELMVQYLLRRGFSNPESINRYLDYQKYPPASPYDLPDMGKGIDLIRKAIRCGERIGVWGDFDVDGQSSTALLVSALRLLGADVVYHIPIRASESHGISLQGLKDFLRLGVKIILTCDTGSSAVESIAYAQSCGINVVITDHHLLPEQLPNAAALINPRNLELSHPLSVLAGVGTAYKFAEALLTEFGKEADVELMHDLVALGTVADVAELTSENRYLVQSGLASLQSAPRPALLAMLLAAEIDPLRMSEEHIAFSLAPRLNAVGRLDDANPMIEFLLSADSSLIDVQVAILEGLNARRKLLCDQVFDGAMSQIEQDPRIIGEPAIVLHHSDWPSGVIGIVASRLVEIFHRPTILLTGAPGQTLRGSARSINGVDITSALRQNSKHLISYGGHPFAAGLSLPFENLVPFIRDLNNTVQLMIEKGDITEVVQVDAVVQPVDFSVERVNSLHRLAPFGPGNPALVFAAEGMRVTSSAVVGKLGEHLLVDVEDHTGNPTRLIWWNGKRNALPSGKFDLLYSVHPSNYRGEEKVQFEWMDFRAPQTTGPVEIRQVIKKVDYTDHRKSKDPIKELDPLLSPQDVVLWKEGSDGYSLNAINRCSVRKASELVFWTCPPNLSALQAIVDAVKPIKVHWFLIRPQEHNLRVFLKTLNRYLKTEHAKGRTSMEYSELICLTATSQELVELGVQWLVHSGQIKVVNHSKEQFNFNFGGNSDESDRQLVESMLHPAFQEITAFQTYLHRCKLEVLMTEIF